MADNYLENHREEYERKKAIWLQKKHRIPRVRIEKPEDEAL